MREIDAEQITEAVAQMCMDANYFIPEDVRKRIEEMAAAEATDM